MLKKQTVWLLTMLSLVVVLSVYYIMSPEGENVVSIDKEQVASEKEKPMEEKPVKEKDIESKDKPEGKQDKETSAHEQSDQNANVVTKESSDKDLFTTYRMEMEDQRSKMREELNEIVRSDKASAKEKSEAYDKMTELSDAEGTEKTLETLIKTKGYEDALVNADGDKVNITVKSKDHSKSAAIDIIDIVKKEVNKLNDVAITFEPAK
ncbi:SpoIIIAH-like family protein [Bacillus sp. CLL-7-23]|uniref:SpoIIIAH-like family protein n=1 Tax=Bacillus changyiensis TaxID=3004103 RepID=A0ABT4X4B5_9BACI|nr:SpoIIIAH-like family protein [Bacillus changyiensis]MDA7026995.1 SpoIIIAH-like family protein [Bacillus changyiensis]